jgi:formate hydrogenlyase subunit 3/multisubunit Na+/H+ antiporter MnhD subunit
MIGYGIAIMAVALLILLADWAKTECISLRFMLLSTSSALALLIGYARVLFSGQTQAYILNLPSFIGMADIVIDPLAAFVGMIFAFGSLWGIIYGHFYLKAHSGEGIKSHLFFIGLMLLSMHFVLMLRHSLLFMIAWEMMSLASFFAILQDRSNKETITNAMYYFVMMHVGAAVLLLGFGLLYKQSGSLNFGGIPINGLAKWLLLIGFAFKAGFFPFYSWLPKAHPVAPAHLSGMMSGLMIKTGVFGIIMVLIRAIWQPLEIYILLGVALITAFNGVIHALAETNIKRALAYSSIENIGIIGIGLSLWLLGRTINNQIMGTLGFAGAMLHMLNHSLFKPLLFYLSGNILASTHTLDMDRLGGLSKSMPQTALLFMFGTAAITALPVMNGFISEFGIFLGILSGFRDSNLGSTLSSVVAGAGLAFVSALALIAFSKMFSIAFSGEPRSEAAVSAKEMPAGMLISPALLAVLCLGLGIFGGIGLRLVIPLSTTFGLNAATLNSFAGNLTLITVVYLLLLSCFAVFYLLKRHFSITRKAATWGCAYPKPSSRMQYTGSAYINPLAYFLKPFMHKTSDRQIVEGYFPRQLEYSEEVRDYLDRGIISTLCKGLKRLFRLFDGIHNGKTNTYITYLLLALLVLLTWVLGVPR